MWRDRVNLLAIRTIRECISDTGIYRYESIQTYLLREHIRGALNIVRGPADVIFNARIQFDNCDIHTIFRKYLSRILFERSNSWGRYCRSENSHAYQWRRARRAQHRKTYVQRAIVKFTALVRAYKL